jgi:hypothetical protein
MNEDWLSYMESTSFIEAVRYAIDLRLSEVDALPAGVQLWMAFMRTLYLSSVVFVFWKIEARFVLAMGLSTAILIVGAKTFFPEIHSGEIGTVVHLLLWTPVLIYLVSRRAVFLSGIKSKYPPSLAYGVWSFVVVGVLATSLVLDLMSILGWLA